MAIRCIIICCIGFRVASARCCPGFLESEEEFELVDDFRRAGVAQLEFLGEPIEAVAALFFVKQGGKLLEVDSRVDRLEAVGRLQGRGAWPWAKAPA